MNKSLNFHAHKKGISAFMENSFGFFTQLIEKSPSVCRRWGLIQHFDTLIFWLNKEKRRKTHFLPFYFRFQFSPVFIATPPTDREKETPNGDAKTNKHTRLGSSGRWKSCRFCQLQFFIASIFLSRCLRAAAARVGEMDTINKFHL